VKKRQPKPTCGVLWEQISEDQLHEIPILRRLKSYPATRARPGPTLGSSGTTGAREESPAASLLSSDHLI
jgi:hypothetical protein